MGTVWLAEQSNPVGRRVALKVIKLGVDTRQVVLRFEARASRVGAYSSATQSISTSASFGRRET